MSRSVLCLLLAAALAGGCKRHAPASVAGGADPSSSPEAAPASPRGPGFVPEAGSNAVVIQAGDANTVLQQLTLELRRYVVHTRSVPRTFAEFAAKSQIQVPPPPAGKKYAIQGQAVVLVKN